MLSCKSNENLLEIIHNKRYLMETSDLYSLSDLCAAIQGKLLGQLSNAAQQFIQHIQCCEVWISTHSATFSRHSFINHLKRYIIVFLFTNNYKIRIKLKIIINK